MYYVLSDENLSMPSWKAAYWKSWVSSVGPSSSVLVSALHRYEPFWLALNCWSRLLVNVPFVISVKHTSSCNELEDLSFLTVVIKNYHAIKAISKQTKIYTLWECIDFQLGSFWLILLLLVCTLTYVNYAAIV